jgi:tetratricopeptide (TPR) repeat protein
MPSHIFLQLGLWHDAAASDRAAFDASTARGKRLHLNPALRNFHALSWLQYELLQLGRYAEAQRVIDEMQAAVDARKALPDSESRGGHQPLQSNLSSMRARFAIETRRWELLASEEQFGNIDELLGIGLSAVRTGNKAVADRVRQALALRATSPEEGDLRPSIAIMEGEIAGMLALKYGARGEGISMLESAARSEMALPPPFGPPQPVKPATELFAEMMMEIERPSDAVEWYEHTLRRHPNRTLAVLGLARAHLAAGQPAAAATRYRELLANLDGADAGRPEIAEARRALETAPPPAPAPPPERPYAWIIAIVAAAGIAAIGVATTVAKKNRRKSRRTRRTQRTPRPGRP